MSNLLLNHISSAQYERIPATVFQDAHDASVSVAQEIADLIIHRAAEGKMCVLGLATGSTPLGVYAELVRMHRADKLSFANVITFNLDEYYPMNKDDLQSYHHFMFQNLFGIVDIDVGNVHIPSGTVAEKDIEPFCRAYEQMIQDAGGIDLQLLGIGRTGHIGFNEPGSSRASRTRLIALDQVTRRDAAAAFYGEEKVPRVAITMGVGTVLEARRIILLAFGENKAAIVAKMVEGAVVPEVPASFLQEHRHAKVVLDAGASAGLTRSRNPWLVGSVDWNEPLVRKAVIWLAREVKKPILKLSVEDYNQHGLQELLAKRGSAHDINIEVFRRQQETISGWPGGKPDTMKRPGDITRKTDSIFPKRVMVFSPHPDDDVISMGGTLLRLVEQGHDVHIVYQTSGATAVFDDDAHRYAEFGHEFSHLFGTNPDSADVVEKRVDGFLKNKKPGDIDTREVWNIKAAIRRCEARAAARYCGVRMENVHFLNMPFYETGQIAKKPLAEEDILLCVGMIERIKPHQIYAAGDLSDPHGTHRICLTAILRALTRLADHPWRADCEVWLYRGAWQEWGVDEIEMAVPLSPDELLRKRHAIFKHQSQKDMAVFPGDDSREFWQRAEERNRATARLYDELGLAEYEAIEGFVCCKLPQMA